MYIGDAILHGYMGDHNKPLEGSLLNNQVVVPNIFYFYHYLKKWSNLTTIFQMGWNHQLDNQCKVRVLFCGSFQGALLHLYNLHLLAVPTSDRGAGSGFLFIYYCIQVWSVLTLQNRVVSNVHTEILGRWNPFWWAYFVKWVEHPQPPPKSKNKCNFFPTKIAQVSLNEFYPFHAFLASRRCGSFFMVWCRWFVVKGSA